MFLDVRESFSLYYDLNRHVCAARSVTIEAIVCREYSNGVNKLNCVSVTVADNTRRGKHRVRTDTNV